MAILCTNLGGTNENIKIESLKVEGETLFINFKEVTSNPDVLEASVVIPSVTIIEVGKGILNLQIEQ